MTTQQLIDKARSILGDRTAVYWPDSELTSFLSDGVRDLAKKTKAFQKEELLTILDGTKVYKLTEPEVIEVIEAFDETHRYPLWLKPYSLDAERNADTQTLLVDQLRNIVVPRPFDGAITVRYAFVPSGLGDGNVVYDLDQDGTDDQVTYDLDQDGSLEKVYWVEGGNPADWMPGWALDALVDYIVYRAYTVDRAEQNLQKAQFHQLRYEGEVRRLKELAFRGYNAKPATIAYQGF